MLSSFGSRCLSTSLLILAGGLLVGCNSSPAPFRRYETYAKVVVKPDDSSSGLSSGQWQDISETLEALFGTSDQPRVPDVENAAVVLDEHKLQRAAGPVHSDELGVAYGLYREHCAHCHGVTGDGNGPTAAFLNPYPRDYRPGRFKFKSTPLDVKPTHADLKKILMDGIPGTAMPSFKLLSEEEVDALVYYVKYLAIRGQAEQQLIVMTNDLDEGERLVNPEGPDGELATQLEDVKEKVGSIVNKWATAGEGVVEIPPRPAMNEEELIASRKRGRDLFYGTIANCAKCHGDSALGDGTTTDYDQWTKDFVDPGKPGDDTKKLVQQFVALGMPEPRTIRPRNLRQGVFRGGNRPIDIYWRIANGIEGTPMPAATPKPEDNPYAKGLTPDDIWDIVNYVMHLQYEPLSLPPEAVELNRPRL